MEARTKELLKAEKEYSLKQFSQLIPNFDPSMLKHPISSIPIAAQEQSPKNPMFNKASCSGATTLVLEDENPELNLAEAQQDEMLDLPPPLKALCHYAETTLKAFGKTLIITIAEEVFGFERETFILHEDIFWFAAMVEIGATVIAIYIRYLFEFLKMTNMVNLLALSSPAQVSAQSGLLS
ncbi:hypothetical protein L3X38_042263 [Prunus dulcis]|uniref:Uncharacterized protein n=1 Tax=Prunus dulcis TaxID=3755 RepID=A0AAD4YLE9_PRUDU|nr:hypothetical protein L3X38_042263 [Prunus dulcis]